MCGEGQKMCAPENMLQKKNTFHITSNLKIVEPYEYVSTMIMLINTIQNVFTPIFTYLCLFLHIYTHLHAFIQFVP